MRTCVFNFRLKKIYSSGKHKKLFKKVSFQKIMQNNNYVGMPIHDQSR